MALRICLCAFSGVTVLASNSTVTPSTLVEKRSVAPRSSRNASKRWAGETAKSWKGGGACGPRRPVHASSRSPRGRQTRYRSGRSSHARAGGLREEEGVPLPAARPRPGGAGEALVRRLEPLHLRPQRGDLMSWDLSRLRRRRRCRRERQRGSRSQDDNPRMLLIAPPSSRAC
jgi:hypothetical protein